MNRIDRRFLDFSLIVKGIFNNPPSVSAGDVFIVGSEPTGDFEGVTPNFIACYNNTWEFTPPTQNQELFNLDTEETLIYQGNSWSRYPNKNLIHFVTFAMLGYDTAPEPNEGFYFNTATNEAFQGNSINWDKISLQYGDNIIVRLSNGTWKRFYIFDSIIQEAELTEGLYIIEHGNIDSNNTQITYPNGYYSPASLYFRDSTGYFNCIYPSDTSSASTSSGKEFYTETHTLTAEEVTNKAFTLAYSVESGEETNILCSISGIIQPAGVAFEVSGNTLNWGNKTLDGSLNAGDVFVVHYVKAAE